MGTVQHQAAVDGARRIGYRTAGEGPSILLLHGIGSGSLSFEPQLTALADRFRLVAWDTPGYGGSDGSPLESPTPADYAEDVVRLLDALGIEKTHVVGHSLGGLITTALVARHPQRVDRVVLSSCAGGYGALDDATRTSRLDERMEQMRRLGPQAMAEQRAPNMLARATGDEIRQQAVSIMARLRPDGYFQACRLLACGNAFEELKHWPSPPPPTLVLVGSEDGITPPASVRRIAHCIAGAELIEIDDAGHAAYLEQPERYSSLLAEFFT